MEIKRFYVNNFMIVFFEDYLSNAEEMLSDLEKLIYVKGADEYFKLQVQLIEQMKSFKINIEDRDQVLDFATRFFFNDEIKELIKHGFKEVLIEDFDLKGSIVFCSESEIESSSKIHIVFINNEDVEVAAVNPSLKNEINEIIKSIIQGE